MKPQDRLLSTSSSKRDQRKKVESKAVGCISGLFHLVSSSFTSSRNKFLTFGKRQEKKEELLNNGNNTTTSSPKRNVCHVELVIEKEKEEEERERLVSCDDHVRRSPSLPAQMRRQSKYGTQPGVVARLMGLNEEECFAATTATTTAAVAANNNNNNNNNNVSATTLLLFSQKRQQLMTALEKCDEDLKALKDIIDAASRGDHRFLVSPSHFTTTTACYHSRPHSHLHDYGKIQYQYQRQQKKKAREDDYFSPNIFDKIACESLQRKIISNNISNNHMQIIEECSRMLSSSTTTTSLPSLTWNKKAMKDSVEQVCRDIAWGKKREIGRIGLVLQDHIFRQLIEEIVIDLGSLHLYNNNVKSLPFEACKKRLCF